MFRTRTCRAAGRGPGAEGTTDGAASNASTIGSSHDLSCGTPSPFSLSPQPSALGPEAGFTLAGLLVILTIITVFVAYTVPRQWSLVMARERDQQTLFAMKQYARAMRAFQEKNKALPVSLDQLKEARQPRLMRGKGELIDPLTGNVDWVVVPASAVQGQQQTAPNLPPGVAPPAGGGTPDGGGLVIGYRGAPTPAPGPSSTPGNTATQPAEGSPGGAVGPMAGVRPNKSGQSYLVVKGVDQYEQWMYTTQDLEAEIATTRNSIMVK